MKTHIEEDGFEFAYDPVKEVVYYPYDRELTKEVNEKFFGWRVERILF